MAVIYTPHFAYFTDDDGQPLAGGKLYTYEAGTTTPKATYTAEDGLTPNANPVVLDASGRATLFLSGSYKFRLTTSADVLVEETDNVTAFATGDSGVDDIVSNFPADTMVEADSIIFSDASDGNTTKRTTLTNFAATAADVQAGTANKYISATVGKAALGWVYGASQATTSGSSVNVTGLPSGVKDIEIYLSGVSTTGTGIPVIQLRDSGGLETSGYTGTIARDGSSANMSSGFTVNVSNTAANAYRGKLRLCLEDSASNLWSCQIIVSETATGPYCHVGVGEKALTAVLDGFSLVTSDAFDAGTLYYRYKLT